MTEMQPAQRSGTAEKPTGRLFAPLLSLALDILLPLVVY